MKNHVRLLMFFKEDFIYDHTFRLTDKTYLNDQPICVIKFYALEEVASTKNTADGVIYISYNDFAIHKLE